MRLYFKDNRNTEKLKDPSECVVGKLGGKGSEGGNHSIHGVAALTFPFFPSPTDLRVQMLKHTKHDIVHALCALPKTQHDFSSFMVDMCFQMVSTCSSLGSGR